MLPDGDGFELVTHVRANPKTRDVPIIIISAIANIRKKNGGGDPNVVAWLDKPFDQDLFDLAVKEALSLDSHFSHVLCLAPEHGVPHIVTTTRGT